MILLVDLCYKKNSLGADEFVGPIMRIVQKEGFYCETRHFREVTEGDLASSDRVILCGTALKDSASAAHPNFFSWLKVYPKPILGICAGMEVITCVFGGTLADGGEIGMTDIRVVADDPLFLDVESFQAYELHSLSVIQNKLCDVLAVSDFCIQAVKHHTRPVYGVMFHPEVRNEWLIQRFLHLPVQKPV